MPFEESPLQDRYDLVNLGVASGTQISSRTSAVVSKLSPTTASTGSGEENKPVIVALTGKSQAAGKLISIAEIAKREIVAKGGKVFQYNALSSRMVEMPRKSLKNGQDGQENVDEDESDDAFEVMGEVKLSEKVKRNVPIMTVYLSAVAVKELRDAYGEQT